MSTDATAPMSAYNSLAAMLLAAARRLVVRRSRRRHRLNLHALDDRLLRDIGLTRGDVARFPETRRIR